MYLLPCGASGLPVKATGAAPSRQVGTVWNVCPGHIGTYSLGVIGLLRLGLPETAGFPVPGLWF